jgi:hypothetical protein
MANFQKSRTDAAVPSIASPPVRPLAGGGWNVINYIESEGFRIEGRPVPVGQSCPT